ncbi:MAG: AMP-binding protein [Coriobacteriia bacterium]|nr:AMP-binding protein [Coriobacteriia bacterium]
MNDILHEFERLSRAYGSHPFIYLQGEGPSRTYSFAQLNFAAAALARELAKRGAVQGSTVLCRAYNSPELVVAVLAAAYGGFDLALLSPHLSSAKAEEARSQLKSVAISLEEPDFLRLMLDACGRSLGELSTLASDKVSAELGRLGLDVYIDERLEAFDPAESGVCLFEAQGTQLVAASYSWAALARAAVQANEKLEVGDAVVWQLVLSLCDAKGLKVLMCALMSASSVLVYEHYSALRVLNDVLPFKVTHISLTEAHLRDLLETNYDGVLCQYRCILLEDGKPSRRTSWAARRAGAHLVELQR